jgi:hypothetical protein
MMSLVEDVDVSIPNTNTEELLACIHILHKMYEGDYGAVDCWLFSSNPNLSGEIPIDSFKEGHGIVILEYLRDVSQRAAERVNGGMN